MDVDHANLKLAAMSVCYSLSVSAYGRLPKKAQRRLLALAHYAGIDKPLNRPSWLQDGMEYIPAVTIIKAARGGGEKTECRP